MNILSVLYKIYKYDNSYFKKIYRIFSEFEKSSLDEIQNYQVKQLKILLTKSYNNVEYYKELFDDYGFNPEKFKYLEDLSKLPVLTKEIIVKNREKLISKEYQDKKLIEITTGGTTGKPMSFYFSKQSKNVRIANWANWKKMSGVDYRNDKFCYIGKILNSEFPIKKDFTGDTLLFASNKMNSQNIYDLFKELEKFKPQYIQGYASALYILAIEAIKLNIDLSNIKLKAILTSSDTLFPRYREVIEDLFRCKVFDHYGQNEDCVVSTECQFHNGYHIHEETTYAEIIDFENNLATNGVGKIVGTNLWNYAMPLIRYEIGDVGRIEKNICECGKSHRRILDFQGRIDDIIKLPNGTNIAAGSLNQPMKKSFREIIEVQYIQKSLRELYINLVPDVNFSSNTLINFERELKLLIGNDLNIKFNIVDHIEREKNGKYKFIKSEL